MLPYPTNQVCVTWIIAAMLLFAPVGAAQSRKFTGQVFAYNPWEHAVKVPSFVKNQEVVIFRLRNRPLFVKLVFATVGQEQLDKKYLNGSTTIAVRAKRDSSCDENSPKFFAKGEPLIPSDAASLKTSDTTDIPLEHKYLIAAAFSAADIPQITHVDCYLVETPRQ